MHQLVDMTPPPSPCLLGVGLPKSGEGTEKEEADVKSKAFRSLGLGNSELPGQEY